MINTNALKVTRRQARAKKGAAAVKAADERILTLACKALGAPETQTPTEKISLLTAYFERLQGIQADIIAEFGERAKKEVHSIEVDMGKIISLITRLRMEQVKADRLPKRIM